MYKCIYSINNLTHCGHTCVRTHIGGKIEEAYKGTIVAYIKMGETTSVGLHLGDIQTQPTPDGRGEQGPPQPHTSSGCCLVGHGGLVGSTGLEYTVCLVVDLDALVWG